MLLPAHLVFVPRLLLSLGHRHQQHLSEPVEAGMQVGLGGVRVGGARIHDVPVAVCQREELQMLRDLPQRHRPWVVLLVCQDEQRRVPQLVLHHHPVELLPRLVHSVQLAAVDHEDNRLRVLVVQPPECASIRRAAQIPQREDDLAVLDALAVEADGGCAHAAEVAGSVHVGKACRCAGSRRVRAATMRTYDVGGGQVAALEAVDDGGLPRAVEADHDYARLVAPQELRTQRRQHRRRRGSRPHSRQALARLCAPEKAKEGQVFSVRCLIIS